MTERTIIRIISRNIGGISFIVWLNLSITQKHLIFFPKLPESRSKRQSINSVFVTLGAIKEEKQKLVRERGKHFFTMWVNKTIFFLFLFLSFLFSFSAVFFTRHAFYMPFTEQPFFKVLYKFFIKYFSFCKINVRKLF